VSLIPPFDDDGLLPPGDYVVSFEQLKQSVLVSGVGQSTWDTPWRLQLVNNLEILTRQLWSIGLEEVFADGSFAEDKDHPNDIDGYFECELDLIRTGELTRQLNLLDPYKVWTWDPAARRSFRGYPKKQLPMWHQYRVELYPTSADSRAAFGIGRVTNSSFHPPSGSPAGTENPGASSKSNLEHDLMIRNETEYQEASLRLSEERARLEQHRKRLESTGLTGPEIKRVMDPMESFHMQLQEEVESYERLKRGEFEDLHNLRGLGHLLISARIAQGISQRELAKRLGIHESQISRDERNEYFGITLERAVKVMDALNLRLTTTIELPAKPEVAA